MTGKKALRVAGFACLVFAASASVAQQPMYQRQRSLNGPGWSRPLPYRQPGVATASGWAQRPYPYHLDYYRMRYGGDYSPYFGNLYGPPAVAIAPQYYGDGAGYWCGQPQPAAGPAPATIVCPHCQAEISLNPTVADPQPSD